MDKTNQLAAIQQAIQESFSLFLFLWNDLLQFDNCKVHYQRCLQWLQQGKALIAQENEQWITRMLTEHAEFLLPLNHHL